MINKVKQLEFQIEVLDGRLQSARMEVASHKRNLMDLKNAYLDVSNLATKAIFDLREEEDRTSAFRKIIRNYELFTIFVGALVLTHVAFIAVHSGR